MMRMKYDQESPSFLTLKVVHPEGEITLLEDVPIKNEETLRKCIWMDENQKLRCSQVTEKPMNWRFSPNNEAQRNYPPEKCCEYCHQSKECVNGC